MKSLLKYLLLSLGVVSLTACGGGSDGPGPVDSDSRTVLVYFMAENSLSSFATAGESSTPEGDISEILDAAGDVPDDCHLIIFLDDANKNQNPRIFEVMKTSKEDRGYLKTIKEYDEELCSTDPAVLRDVMKMVKADFPASGYGLVLWSHGSAWLHAKTTKDTRSIGIDNEKNSSSNSGPEMEIVALKEVIEDFGKLDFLYLDACFMQTVEVAYELRNVTDYLIGCPTETPGTGGAYHNLVASMFLADAQAAAQGIVEKNYTYYNTIYELVPNRLDTSDPYYRYNYGIVMSAINCGEMDALAAVTKPLIQKYGTNKTVLSLPSNVQAYNSLTSSYPDFYDINGVIHQVADDSEYEAWKTQFDKVMTVRKATPQWYSSRGWMKIKSEDDSPFGCVSMYVPKTGGNYTSWNSDFLDTSWYADVWSGTGW